MVTCTPDPWPIAAQCLPPVPPAGTNPPIPDGLYPGFVPGDTAVPGVYTVDAPTDWSGEAGTGPLVPAFLPGAHPGAIGPYNPAADAAAVWRLRVAMSAAAATLFVLLGQRHVVRCATVRPCSSGPGVGRGVAAMSGGFWIAYLDGHGSWQNYDPCAAGRCDPLGRGAIRLPSRFGPVREVVGVEVDGVELAGPPDAEPAWVLEGDILYRTTGGAWPTQDLGLPLGSPGTWSVTYRAGFPPPPGTELYVAALATELYALCGDTDAECRIPRGWASISREGVTVNRIDTSTMLAQRSTGLPEVDMWIAAHNPHRLVSPPQLAGPATMAGLR